MKTLYNLVRLRNNNNSISVSAEKAARIVSSLKFYSVEDNEANISEIFFIFNICPVYGKIPIFKAYGRFAHLNAIPKILTNSMIIHQAGPIGLTFRI